jgi:hypothetical protein
LARPVWPYHKPLASPRKIPIQAEARLGFRETLVHTVPKFRERVINVPGLREAKDVAMDQFHPVLNRYGVFDRIHLVVEAVDGTAQRQAVKRSKHRRRRRHEPLLIVRMFIAHPAEFPAGFRDAMKGVEDMWRGQASGAFLARSPAPIEKNTPFASEAGQQVSSTQIRPYHLVRRRGIRNADVPDMVPA